MTNLKIFYLIINAKEIVKIRDAEYEKFEPIR